jgi:hypothetical protein
LIFDGHELMFLFKKSDGVVCLFGRAINVGVPGQVLADA